jgi:hypothetical protein
MGNIKIKAMGYGRQEVVLSNSTRLRSIPR